MRLFRIDVIFHYGQKGNPSHGYSKIIQFYFQVQIQVESKSKSKPKSIEIQRKLKENENTNTGGGTCEGGAKRPPGRLFPPLRFCFRFLFNLH